MKAESSTSSVLIQIPGTLSIMAHLSAQCTVILSFKRTGRDSWSILQHALSSRGFVTYREFQAPFKSDGDWVPA